MNNLSIQLGFQKDYAMGLRDIPYNKGHSKSISIKPGDSPVNFLLVTRKLNALLKRQKSILCTMYKKNIYIYQNM